ncbi:MAG TPA: HD-GYP domain-containing protein, partial [Gaiellaceae bacterium]|nr:HD-GYP domain-containing protein [Gaiellaceae bacterium]
ALVGFQPDDATLLWSIPFPHERAREILASRESFQTLSTPVAAGSPDLGEAAIAIAPLEIDADRLGCIIVRGEGPDDTFDERSMRLLAGVAHQVKLAIANVSNFESLERTFLSTVEALANALEANDEYTSSHARWITDLSLHVGRALGLDARTLKRLELGALFHDIGKIGIPEAILTKPGPLDDEEWKVVRLHPELGARILAPIERLEEVCEIVLHCHEHWDGSGYPNGLAGEEIPLEARVILVCDAYHAMTSDRAYRKRLPEAEARRRLEEASGTQFDPKIVEVFLALEDAAQDGRAA